MDPVTIATVLGTAAGAGALAGLTDATKSAVASAYGALRDALAEKFRGDPKAELVLAAHAEDADAYAKPLAKVLDETGAAQDPRITALAAALAEALRSEGGVGPAVTIMGNVDRAQFGNHNIQINP